jgi:isoamyl acetate esterase
VIDKKASLVFLYIGINDVWHSNSGNGTPAKQFEQGLRTLVQELKSSGAEVVLATPSVIGEQPQGQNPLDKMLDQYSAISREVAAQEGAILCDLRRAFFDHLQVFNPTGQKNGVLTTDGVHLNSAGNLLLATVAARSLRLAVLARKLKSTTATNDWQN